jgi:hypothetical protein
MTQPLSISPVAVDGVAVDPRAGLPRAPRLRIRQTYPISSKRQLSLNHAQWRRYRTTMPSQRARP